MALTARQAPFLWLSRDRPTNHSLVTLWGPQAVKMISLAASRWFKVGLPAQRWSSIPTCRSQLYGHFTSLSVHGQETCQSKTPHWLVNPAHHPPSAPCSKVHPILGAHTSRLQLGGCTHPPTMPHLELHNSKVQWLCHYALKQYLVISPYPCQWMVNPHLFQDETKKGRSSHQEKAWG